MRHHPILGLLALPLLGVGLLAPAPQAAGADLPFDVGMTMLEIGAPSEARALEARVWYPARDSGGTASHLGENAVWQGFDAHVEAPIAKGRFPLVVLSHGLYGNSTNQAWLATVLARDGIIVAAPNHPGTTTFDRNPGERAHLWLRPDDLSRTITALLASERLGGAIDDGHISAVGHSLGGFTVVALAGGRVDMTRYRGFCAGAPDLPDCAFFRQSSIARDAASTRSIEASMRDPRVGAIVTLDLGATQSFAPASLAAIDLPVMVIAASEDDPMLPIDTESRALAAMLPASRLTYLELDQASHFTFLGLCKPGAEEVLKVEEPGDEIVCRDHGGDRRALQAMVAERIQAFLEASGMAFVTRSLRR